MDSFLFQNLVLILPMRNGNLLTKLFNFPISSSFLSYLWGMETSPSTSPSTSYTSVFLSYLWGMETISTHNSVSSGDIFVLILPMRNGNSNRTTVYNIEFLLFLSYLWGMETYLMELICILWTLFLSYLWGMETASILVETDEIVPAFLSYLWGMETWKSKVLLSRNSSSYPTYEEWKPFSLIVSKSSICSWFLSYLWGMETILNPFILFLLR